MKFSVLLPTRNRLEYLKYAISSVMQQDYANWEIIVSDNDSENDVKGYVESLCDARIKYYRTPSFCSVTENWNNALNLATGDYTIMLGDDDCLLNGYFSLCLSLINQHQFPDMIYSSALIYAYPKVMPGAMDGYLVKCAFAPFLVEQPTPFILDKAKTHRLAKEIMNFTVSVNLNMQHSLVSSKLIAKMKNYGQFYQSPYPDYYATTSLFLLAERILAVPFPLVVMGMTTKSFGYYYFNNQEKEGMEFLQNVPKDEIYQHLSKYVLSGTILNIFWLFAMETVRMNFGKEYLLKVNYKKFRLLQALHQCRKYACRQGVQGKDMIDFAKSLRLWEKIAYFCPFLFAQILRLFSKKARAQAWANRMAYAFSHPSFGAPQYFPGKYENIMDVFQQVKIDSS